MCNAVDEVFIDDAVVWRIHSHLHHLADFIFIHSLAKRLDYLTHFTSTNVTSIFRVKKLKSIQKNFRCLRLQLLLGQVSLEHWQKMCKVNISGMVGEFGELYNLLDVLLFLCGKYLMHEKRERIKVWKYLLSIMLLRKTFTAAAAVSRKLLLPLRGHIPRT